MKATIEIPEGYTLVKVNGTEYKVVKNEKKLPDTWEEFCNMNPLKKGESWVDSGSEISEVNHSDGIMRKQKWFNLLPNKEKAEAILALCQLIQLRDCYNDGWVPDWKDDNWKAVLLLSRDKWSNVDYKSDSHLFAFKTESLRDKFLENFRELLDKIKPLYQ